MNNQNNYYGSYQYNNYNSPYMRPRPEKSSIAALVCGILATLCCCFGYAGIVFGVVAVFLAFNSRKKHGKFDSLALVGLILGIFGAVISLIAVVSVYLIPEELFDQYFNEYYQQFENGLGSGINPDF